MNQQLIEKLKQLISWLEKKQGMNPLKKSCYEKMCDKGFKDAADKINEIVDWVNNQNDKTKNN